MKSTSKPFEAKMLNQITLPPTHANAGTVEIDYSRFDTLDSMAHEALYNNSQSDNGHSKPTHPKEKSMNESNKWNIDKEKVNLETSKIAWKELQRFFASGAAVFVAPDLDLVEVAYQFSIDNKNQVALWMQSNELALVSDQQAIDWLETDTEVWAVVVKPWILVQQ